MRKRLIRSKTKNPNHTDSGFLLARPEGFEPPTPGSEDQCSIQLSYRRTYSNSNKKLEFYLLFVESPKKTVFWAHSFLVSWLRVQSLSSHRIRLYWLSVCCFGFPSFKLSCGGRSFVGSGRPGSIRR